MFSERQSRELLGLALLVIALFTVLSLIPSATPGRFGERFLPSANLMGPVGQALRHIAYGGLGIGAPIIPIGLVLIGATTYGWLRRELLIRWGLLLLGLSVLVPTLLGLFITPRRPAAPRGEPALAELLAGWLGSSIGMPLKELLGPVGGVLVVLFLLLALPLATIGWNPIRPLFQLIGKVVRSIRTRRERPEGIVGEGIAPEERVIEETTAREQRATDGGIDESVLDERLAIEPIAPATNNREIAELESHAEDDLVLPLEPEEPYLEPLREPEDQPSPELLSAPPPRDEALSEKELDELGETLIETLKTFRVESSIGGRTTGPVVTQFEVVPAPGVKVNRIASLDADIALALRAPSVRIVAPIPGKGAVGVEVPNPSPEVVYLREILDAPVFRDSKGTLPLALGKDLGGAPYVSDLARMPHLLIAGATGSGKSVCINTIITSLIYRHTPETLRLLMIDPKMVELSMYSELPHLRHPVVTDPSDAAVVLKWAVLEMERRYALLSNNGVRSLAEFNERVEAGVTLRMPQPEGEEGDPDRWIYRDGPLPYIVLIVDELADLMMAVQAEIERPLAQLAQKARAIGIHLIVATQRPSVNVITGLIKANFPCRIAFRVSSKVDSRTIIDQNGADALLGNGDMLFLPPGTSDPVRIQGAYLSTEDTERLMAWYREQGAEFETVEDDIIEVVREHEAESAEEADQIDLEDRDVLFREAAEICVQNQQGSTSLLQRRLRIGYGRAARIIDQLHQAGLLGPPDGSKPREVLAGLEILDEG